MSLLRRIVVVSKQSELRQVAQQVGQEIFVADDLAEAMEIVERVNPDLAMFDDSFTPSQIGEFIHTTDKSPPSVPAVVFGNAVGGSSTAADFIEMGAYDYVQQNHDGSQVKQVAARIRSQRQASASEENTLGFFVDDHAAAVAMVGRSRAFVKTLGMIRLVAASRCNPVLIVGETGTGKEVAAKAIHTLRHPDDQFVAVNCAALTANLLESELFGHVKGSFTGADREKIGLLELAGSGTILLDEISEMPLDLQAKLLRVLQEKTFRKVGGVRDMTCNATIIASSNRNLYKEMKANRFRRDLYYRLNICPVFIAPLRSPDRKEDISLLATYFVQTSTICPEKSEKIIGLTKLAAEALEKHSWPGNVRELCNVIDRAILLETTDKIGLSSIILDPAESEEVCESQPVAQIKDFSLAKAERELIARALQETSWQKTQAAALLGITRATLYAKVKQYNIKRSPSSEEGQEEAVPKSSVPEPATA